PRRALPGAPRVEGHRPLRRQDGVRLMTAPPPGQGGGRGHGRGAPHVDLRHARYGPYRGGPDPLAPPFDLREALSDVGEQVMSGTTPRSAIRELLRRGTSG